MTAPTTNLTLDEIEAGDTVYVAGPIGLHDETGEFVEAGHLDSNGYPVFVDEEIIGRNATVVEVDYDNGDVLVEVYLDGFPFRQWTGFEGLTFPVAF